MRKIKVDSRQLEVSLTGNVKTMQSFQNAGITESFNKEHTA